jgi:HD-GYP domain-containing protein (c-di-GMP phosphodiesterase class II)
MNTAREALSRKSSNLFVPLSILVLLVCLFYTYSAAYLAPYPGIIFAFDWIVEEVPANQTGLQVGDQLLKIGDLTYASFERDKSRVPFEGYSTGDLVPITVRRAGQELIVKWQMLGPTSDTFLTRFSGLLIYFPFWLAGSIILLLLRPRDLRWGLLILFNYATAIWLASGTFSFLHVAYSAILQRALAWLLVAFYLHLHLTIPSPLSARARGYLLPPLYALCVLLALLELFQILPGEAFNLGLLVAVFGSIGLLFYRALANPSPADRIALRLMLIGIGLAFGPGIILVVIPTFLSDFAYSSLAGNVAVLAIPLLPFFYIYALYKHRLGKLEFRANRLLSLYSFALLYATAFILVFSIGSQWVNLPRQSLEFGLVVSIAFLTAALPFRARYHRLVDRLAYGARYDPHEIIRVFANRIPAALDRQALIALLTREVTPSLLIRESALYLLRKDQAELLYADHVKSGTPPQSLSAIQQLLSRAGQYRAPETKTASEFDWVRLAISLQVADEQIGVWLLGRRDPDDFYPQEDSSTLNSLGNLIAATLENIRLFEETRTAAQQFGLLYDAGLALNSVLGPQEQLEFLAKIAMKTLHAERAAFFSRDSIRNQMLFQFGIGFDNDAVETMKSLQIQAAREAAFVDCVAKNLLPLNVADLSSDLRWVGIDTQIRSGLWAPVEREQKLRGVLSVYSTRMNAFTPQDERLLVLFANQAAVAMENARLFEAEQTRREELSALYDLSRALADAVYDFDAVLKLIARRAVETLHITFARVVLLEGDAFVVRAAHPIRFLDRDLAVGCREPSAALPSYQRAVAQEAPIILHANSPEVNDHERQNIFLGVAQTVCLVPLSATDHGGGLLILGEARREEREPFTREKLRLARSIADLTLSALHHAGLFADLERAYLQTVLALANAVDAKDTYTADHAQRLAVMARAIGREMGMAPRELEDLRYGAILHDIGKIGVHDAILQKPAKLDPGEWMVMRQHPLIGARILAPVPRLAGAALIVRHHHERYDGSGYPDGLAGKAIPMGARILTVVDAYSAIVDRRVYKEARSHEDAVAELKKHKGTQFDPDIVEIFLKLLEGGETNLLLDQQSIWPRGDEHLQATEKTLFRGM